MASYYNEINKNAAQWIRNLIAAGHIAPGEVDERSIEDVYPDDIRGFTQCHFFAGVAVWSYALRQAGWADDRPVWTGSCPCQPFSAAGKGAGFADERHLWPAFNHLIEQCRPPVVFGEQVASKDGLNWLDLVLSDLEAQGYAAGAVDTCAAGFGAPHIRQRLYWVGYAVDTRLEGYAGHDSAARREGQARSITASSISGRMANAQQHDSRPQAEPTNHGKPQADRPADWTDGCGVSSGWLADTDSDGCESRSERSAAMGYGQAVGADSGTDRPGPTNGYWRDADWLGCRDGKWRPVEPGLKPLVTGAPARMGRLRAYGNSLCAEAAKGFIEATFNWSAA